MGHYHIRVCAVGSESEIVFLLRILLQNVCALEKNEDGLDIIQSRDELLNMVHKQCVLEGGREDGFLYTMLCPAAFGSAEPAESRLIVRQEPCGEWVACFDYRSNDPFQQEDWLWLHERCCRLQLAVQYACDDFSKEKGRVLISGGKMLDNWDCMAEVWFWLMYQYACGETPQGVLSQLDKIAEILRREEYDLEIDELLCSCETNLRLLDEATSEPERLRAAIDQCRENGDWGAVTSYRLMVAENLLWETEHNPKWLACLEAARQSWNGRY